MKEFSYLYTFKDDEYEESVFYKQVDDDFDKIIKINEGQYGKWFTLTEIKSEKKMLEEDKATIMKLVEKL